MTDRKIAVRYARALLAALPKGTDRVAVDVFLDSLAASMESSGELRDALLNPAVPRDIRKNILRELSESRGLPPEVGRFLGIVIDNGRAGTIPTISQFFHAERERAEGVVPVSLTTAVELPPEVVDRAEATFRRLTGRQVRLSARVDPTLVGGVVTQIGSTVYDGSLRTQLHRLRRHLTQE